MIKIFLAWLLCLVAFTYFVLQYFNEPKQLPTQCEQCQVMDYTYTSYDDQLYDIDELNDIICKEMPESMMI